MTKIFVTSDHHFYHANIIRYCNRPFNSYQEMNEEMIKRWNEVVSKEDIVIHLGDFAFKGKARLIRQRLNGTIVLVKGNHDFNISGEDGFLIIDGNLIIDNIIFSHHPIEYTPEGYVNIHGHIHHRESYTGINVSVEKTDYRPINLSNLKWKTKNILLGRL